MAATSVPPAPVPCPVDRLVRQASLVFVSGKGGAGKTTVAGALGLAAAAAGRRTIVCDLAGTGRLGAAFGVTCAPGRETRLAPRLWALELDPRQALREWLRRQPGGPVAAVALGRSAAFAHFVAAAPGAKELVTIGKLLDLAGHAPTPAERVPYDLVIADAAFTGHALGMVAAPGTVAASVPVGAVGEQAAAVREALSDPTVTTYVGVSLPEEMATREVLDLDRGLRAALGRGLDAIVVNAVWPDRLSDAEARRVQEAAGEHPWVRSALVVHRRGRRHAAQLQALRDAAPCPVVALPCVFAPRLGLAGHQRLARALVGAVRTRP